MTDNSTNNKRIAKNTGALYIRMLLVMLVTLYTSRVVLEVLGVEDFGIYNVVAGFVAILGFFSSSLSNATQRFLSIELGKNNLKEANQVFCQSIILFCLISLVLIIIGETAGVRFVGEKLVIPDDRKETALWVFQCSLFMVVLTIIQISFISAIIARERMGAYAYLGILEVVARLLMSVALLYIEDVDSLLLYAIMMASIQLLITLFYVLYCFRHFPECRIRYYWNNSLIKEMGSFIGYNLFGCFAWSAGVQGTNIILNLFFGPAVNAARAVAVQVNGAVNRFTENIMTAIKPQIIKSYACRDFEYMHTLIEKSSKYAFFFMLLISLPILYQTPFILNLWLKDVPDHSVLFVRLMLVETIIGVLVPPLWIAANATGKIKNQQVYGRMFTLAALPLAYLILKFYTQAWIPFVLLIMAQLLYWMYNVRDIHKQIGLNIGRYLAKVLKPIGLVAVVSAILLFGINHCLSDNVADFIVILLASTIILLVNIYCMGMEKSERQLVRTYLQRITKRKTVD